MTQFMKNLGWTRLSEEVFVGGGLSGYFSATVPEMKRLFGDPDITDGGGDGKVCVMWKIKTPAGDFRIYEYKETSTYTVDNPTPEEFLGKHERVPFKWHLGGYVTEEIMAKAMLKNKKK